MTDAAERSGPKWLLTILHNRSEFLVEDNYKIYTHALKPLSKIQVLIKSISYIHMNSLRHSHATPSTTIKIIIKIKYQ